MKPYYQDDQVIVYHGDCRDILPSLEADCIIADPPYEQTDLAWDVWPNGWPEIAAKSLTERGSMWCFGSMRMFMDKCDEFQAWKLAQDIVWEKHNGSSFHADRFRRVHESIVQFYPNGHCWEQIIHNTPHTHDAVKKTVRRKVRPPHMGHIDDGVYTSEDGGPRIMRSVRFVHSTHGYAIHPTQKPVAIILPLLQYSCLPDSVVVDPFGGSLSTLKACLELGLKGIAIEKDQAIIERGLANLYPRMFQPVS